MPEVRVESDAVLALGEPTDTGGVVYMGFRRQYKVSEETVRKVLDILEKEHL